MLSVDLVELLCSSQTAKRYRSFADSKRILPILAVACIEACAITSPIALDAVLNGCEQAYADARIYLDSKPTMYRSWMSEDNAMPSLQHKLQE